MKSRCQCEKEEKNKEKSYSNHSIILRLSNNLRNRNLLLSILSEGSGKFKEPFNSALYGYCY